MTNFLIGMGVGTVATLILVFLFLWLGVLGGKFPGPQ